MWEALSNGRRQMIEDGVPPHIAEADAIDDAIRRQLTTIAIPRRFTNYMRDIWVMQKKFAKRTPKRVEKLISHSKFRAAYDFLCLRAEAGEEVGELAKWWTDFQNADRAEQDRLINSVKADSSDRPKRKRKRRRKSAAATD